MHLRNRASRQWVRLEFGKQLGDRPAQGALHFARGDIVGKRRDPVLQALQLVDVETSEWVWFQNYDYRGIGADLMARDILTYLKLIAPDSVRSRITSDCDAVSSHRGLPR